MYRAGLKGLQGFEISRYSAAKGEKPAPTCLSAIFRNIDEKSRNPVQAFQSDVVVVKESVNMTGVKSTQVDSTHLSTLAVGWERVRDWARGRVKCNRNVNPKSLLPSGNVGRKERSSEGFYLLDRRSDWYSGHIWPIASGPPPDSRPPLRWNNIRADCPTVMTTWFWLLSVSRSPILHVTALCILSEAGCGTDKFLHV